MVVLGPKLNLQKVVEIVGIASPVDKFVTHCMPRNSFKLCRLYTTPRAQLSMGLVFASQSSPKPHIRGFLGWSITPSWYKTSAEAMAMYLCSTLNIL